MEGKKSDEAISVETTFSELCSNPEKSLGAEPVDSTVMEKLTEAKRNLPEQKTQELQKKVNAAVDNIIRNFSAVRMSTGMTPEEAVKLAAKTVGGKDSAVFVPPASGIVYQTPAMNAPFNARNGGDKRIFSDIRIADLIEKSKNLPQSVGQDAVFLIGYEAGPTGYGLCRKLQKEGFACVIIAPSTIAKTPGQKVKTDRMDARLLAKTLAFKTYSPVCLPSEKLEAIKEYTRGRTAKITMLKKAKQNLLSFLLRMGLPYPQSGHYWTQAHMAWLRTVNFADKWLQESFEEYHAEVITLMAKVQRIEAKILELCKDDEVREKIDALVCISGISYVSSISIVAEIGDFSRFSKAKSFVSFIGLCPGEDSSGNRVRHTAITKAGNSRVRSLLVECAGSLRMHSVVTAKSVRGKERQKNASAAIVSYADKCTLRLRKRMLYLSQKGLPYNLVTTAGARELACFVWGMMNFVDNRKTALNKIDEGELSDIQKTVEEFIAQ